jgi:hypothetical protein
LTVGDYSVPGIDTAPLGAFYIQVPWTLSPPLDCACMKKSSLPAGANGAHALSPSP